MLSENALKKYDPKKKKKKSAPKYSCLHFSNI